MRQFDNAISARPRPVSPVEDMAEHLRETFERDGGADADCLKREGYDDDAIARFGGQAVARAAALRTIDARAA